MKFIHIMRNWVGWACRTKILFSSPLLNLHLKVFTKLLDSVSRIQNFPASDRVWGSNIPLKQTCVCKAKKWGSFSDKSHKKIGGIWVPFSQIPADYGSLSEKFPKFWTLRQCDKNNFWQKQGFWADVGGWKYRVKCVAVGAYHCLYVSDLPLVWYS